MQWEATGSLCCFPNMKLVSAARTDRVWTPETDSDDAGLHSAKTGQCSEVRWRRPAKQGGRGRPLREAR